MYAVDKVRAWADTTTIVITSPRNVTSSTQNAHFCALKVCSPCSACSNAALCRSWCCSFESPQTKMSSMYTRTPVKPSKTPVSVFRKTSLAEEITNGSRPKVVAKVHTRDVTQSNGIWWKPELASSQEKYVLLRWHQTMFMHYTFVYSSWIHAYSKSAVFFSHPLGRLVHFPLASSQRGSLIADGTFPAGCTTGTVAAPSCTAPLCSRFLETGNPVRLSIHRWNQSQL